MAEAIAKIKENRVYPATTGDTDGSLLTLLLEALTAGAQLNVGQKGRTTHSPVNYTKGGDASDIVDNHLAGIDTALAGAPVAHALGSASHSADTLANLNAKITGGSLDFDSAARTPTAHALGGSYHSADSLANLNAKVTGGDLDFDSASRTPTAHKTSHESGGGDVVDADTVDAQHWSDIIAYKYHTFADGDYHYDDYQQGRYLRLFTEGATYDNARFGAISNVEYWTSSWVAWTGGESTIETLLNGREDSQVAIDHTHRKFRFEVTRNSGWPTMCLIVLQGTWTGFTYPGITVTVETYDVGWDVKETCLFQSGYTGSNHGTHLKASSNLHDGKTSTRITIDITDWTDNGPYVTMPLKRFMLLSNYAGLGLIPLSWDYAKSVTLPNHLKLGASKRLYLNTYYIDDSGLVANNKVLDSDKVDAAHASATPTASTIPIADGSGKLDSGWLSEVLAYSDLTDDPYADHSARHENGGADEISVAGLSGLLADAQTPDSHGLESHVSCTLAQLNADISDATLAHTAYSLGTDLGGTIATPSVNKIRGYNVQDAAPSDGDILTWVNGNSRYEPTQPGAPGAHLMGSASHTTDSLANLNAKVTGGSLDFAGSPRPPSAHDLHSHGSCTLAQLNADISDATLDTNTSPRPPTGSIVAGDLTGSYPSPGVGKLRGYTVQSGAPATNDILQYISSMWSHVQGIKANYDSGWFSVAYNSTYAKAHGLGGFPSHVEVYWAVTNSSPTTIYRVPHYKTSGETAGRGCLVDLNSTNVIVRTGTESSTGTMDTYGFGGTRVYSAAGYYKVLAWGPTHV